MSVLLTIYLKWSRIKLNTLDSRLRGNDTSYMDHLIEPLKNLGLSEKEAKIYLALLQLGPSTPYQIAKKAELKRPTAYVIAEELVEKGLIVHVPGENKKRYIARTPDAFIEERETKLKEAKAILPELRSFQKGAAEKPSILYFEGAEGIRQGYSYKQKELHNKEVVGFFASAEDISPSLLQVFLDWSEYRKRHNIMLRGLTVDHPSIKPFEKYWGEEGKIITKFMPPELYSAQVSIESCDRKIVKICIMESAQMLVIESPKFAEALAETFELLWKSLEGKYDSPTQIADPDKV